jgi:hypothetical protein
MNTKKNLKKKQPEQVLPPDEENPERINTPKDINKKPQEYGGMGTTNPSRETLKVVGNQQTKDGKQNPFGINSSNTPKRKTKRETIR